MNRIKKSRLFIILLTIVLGLFLILPDDAFSRRGGFGGGRSFRSSSRSSGWKSSRSRSKSAWSSSKSKKMTSRRGTKSLAQSKKDQALYKKAKKNGTTYKSRAEAKKGFNKKYGKQYSSTYDSKPAKRPGHIPQSTKVKGKSYPVNYNPQHRGYGYYGSSGSWIMYSMMTDAVMMSMLMNRHHYYGGEPPMYRSGYGGSFWSGFWVFFIIIFFSIIWRNRF
ncbi:MAG: hypothetical protein P9X24_10550 [Candidatus Hatepunaea meridiana]|nr:hypothetical protein [Candidatus Hatepunaea meridiana]